MVAKQQTVMPIDRLQWQHMRAAMFAHVIASAWLAFSSSAMKLPH